MSNTTKPKTSPEEETEEELPEEEAAAVEPEETAETPGTEPEEEAPEEEAEPDPKDQELQETKERYLRLMAEYDNFRKRSAKEKEGIYADATVAAYTDLLPVLDNFDRAFADPDVSPEDFKKGVEMTRNQLLSVFEKAGVETFGEPGEAFDPNIHNAVMHVEDDQFGDNEIAEVFQKGYKLGGRILRHAMVKVAN